MTQQPEYSHARHMARVQAAARQAGIKGAAFAVLAYLCASADFKRPEVLRSKDNIVERTGYGIAAVKAALATLRAGGFLVPVAYATGGKHRATVYRIEPGKGYENDTPTAAKGVWKSSPKGYGNHPQRGMENSPPSVVSPVSLSGSKGAPFRGGRNVGPLDGGASPAPRPGSPEAEELARFSREVARHGYTEARRLQKARQGEAGQLP